MRHGIEVGGGGDEREVGQSKFTITIYFTYLSDMNCGRWRHGVTTGKVPVNGYRVTSTGSLEVLITF